MVDISDLSKVKWHGKWIWIDDFEARRNGFVHKPSENDLSIKRNEKNIYCLVRKKFEINNEVESAILDITADSRYKLFINGKYVGRGINRCESFYWYFNRYDIKKYLVQGSNVIAIHARFYGQDFAYYTLPGGWGRNKQNAGKGGLLFDLKIKNEDGNEIFLGTDKDTKIIRNLAEKSFVPLKNDALGFIEDFDSREMPKNWNEIEFDDSNWKKPIILDYPIKNILIDENHPLYEEIEPPVEIISIGENDDINYDEDMDEEDKSEMDFNIQHMLEGTPEDISNFQINNEDFLIGNRNQKFCEIIPKPNAKGKVLSVFIRFNREMVGYPRLVVEGEEGTIIDIIPTEKMTNNMPALDFLSHKRGSRLILRGEKQFFEQWDWEGYLYMLIKIRNLTKPLKIYELATNRTHMRISENGTFNCSNKELNELWEACAFTVLCCAIDGYLDCPSREQRAYLGDAYPEALIANACFGEPRLTKKLIYDTAFGQRKDGITYSFHPGDAENQTHIIPDYCLYWIQIAKDYYAYYGDEKALRDLYPHFILAMEWFWKYIDDETGLLSDLPYWTFIDWSFGHNKPGKWAILNTQFMDVLNFLTMLAQKFGDDYHSAKFEKKAEELKPKIDEMFWDAEKGYYRDYYYEGTLHGSSYMTNSYLVLMDITQDKTKIESIISNVFEYPGAEENIKMQIDDFYLKRMSHHAFGDALKEQIVVAQPFFQHQVNKFFAKVGRFDLIMYYIKKWLPMLDLGQTKTIWETWSIAGSECHAWAATPAYDLSTYWLGVKPLRPGFESIEISPTFYELEKVDGMYPTCKGNVLINWEKTQNDGSIIINLNIGIPDAIKEGIFIVPKIKGKKISKIDTDSVKKELSENIFIIKPKQSKFVIIYD